MTSFLNPLVNLLHVFGLKWWSTDKKRVPEWWEPLA